MTDKIEVREFSLDLMDASVNETHVDASNSELKMEVKKHEQVYYNQFG